MNWRKTYVGRADACGRNVAEFRRIIASLEASIKFLRAKPSRFRHKVLKPRQKSNRDVCGSRRKLNLWRHNSIWLKSFSLPRRNKKQFSQWNYDRKSAMILFIKFDVVNNFRVMFFSTFQYSTTNNQPSRGIGLIFIFIIYFRSLRATISISIKFMLHENISFRSTIHWPVDVKTVKENFVKSRFYWRICKCVFFRKKIS